MHPRSTTRIYVGRLEPVGPAVYAADADGVQRLEPDAAPFRWGRGGRTDELARTLLTDATGSDPGADACRRFAREILAHLPEDGFSLPRDTVAAWMRRCATVS